MAARAAVTLDAVPQPAGLVVEFGQCGLEFASSLFKVGDTLAPVGIVVH